MPQMYEQDEWLMTQVAQGKRDQLEPLLRRHAASLLTFLRRMLGDRHDSEEIFQEVFLAVWRKRTQYQFPRPFKAWLFGIALNKCRETFRARPQPGSFAGDLAETPAVAGPSPTDEAIATETAALVAAAVTRLPPQQRTVVVLRIWDGLSYAEIAEALGRSEGTVRANMHHGLVTLREHLEPRLKDY